MKKTICLMLSLMMLCSLLVVNVSASDTYEAGEFAIDMNVDGEWEVRYAQEDSFSFTGYLFVSDSGWTDLTVVVEGNDPKGYFEYVRADLSSEGMGFQTGFIGGVECFYYVEKHEGELNEYESSYHYYFACLYTENYGYYIEINSNADGGAVAEAEFESLVASVNDMRFDEKSGKTDKESGDNKSLTDDKNTENTDKDSSTVIIVAIVVGGVVILGLGAMITFGRKKK